MSLDNGLWRNQLNLVKVIDGGNTGVMGVSHDIIRRSRADNDGDLMPIYFGDAGIQECIKSHYYDQFETTQVESEWEHLYYLDESDASLMVDMQDPIKNRYCLYEFSSVDLKDRLFDASLAKNTVGMGTTQFWTWSDAVNLYYNEYSGRMKVVNGERMRMMRMSDEVRKELISAYAIILQMRVIGAIKHMEGGSKSYQLFMLENLGNIANKPKVIKEIQSDLAFLHPRSSDSDRMKVMKTEMIQLIFYISSLFREKGLGLFKNLGEMYGLYNKGEKLPDGKVLSDEIKLTSFYEIVSIIDSWRDEAQASQKLLIEKLKTTESPF
jgi:hypothetical protein